MLTTSLKANHSPVNEMNYFQNLTGFFILCLLQVFLVRKVFGEDSGTLYAMKVLKKATLKGREYLLEKLGKFGSFFSTGLELHHGFQVQFHLALL